MNAPRPVPPFLQKKDTGEKSKKKVENNSKNNNNERK